MIEITIPGAEVVTLEHLVMDYNGTLALDGDVKAGVVEMLKTLAKNLKLHVLTADTHGTVKEKVASLDCTLHVIGPGNQDKQKADYVRQLGKDRVVALGNGRNDIEMLRISALGFALLQEEGLTPATFTASSIVFTDIRDALGALIRPERIVATLRNA